jgi:hypothetical protein
MITFTVNRRAKPSVWRNDYIAAIVSPQTADGKRDEACEKAMGDPEHATKSQLTAPAAPSTIRHACFAVLSAPHVQVD